MTTGVREVLIPLFVPIPVGHVVLVTWSANLECRGAFPHIQDLNTGITYTHSDLHAGGRDGRTLDPMSRTQSPGRDATGTMLTIEPQTQGPGYR
jgi:hypothetical protein